MTNRRLDKALRKSNKKKEDKVILLSGELGIPLNGQKLVEVPNRKGFVFVRLKNNTSELIQAYNASVSPIYDLPVLVARQVGGYKIVGRNIDRYSNQWGNAPYLPKHGPQHSFNPSLSIGGDVVWVYSQQFMPLLGYPSGSSGSPQLAISPYIVRDLNGNWKYIGNTGTPDTTPYNPTTGSRATMVLVYLDTVSGNPALLVNSGTYMDGSLTGSSDVAQFIPPVTNPNWIPSVAIRLVSGTSVLTWNNLYDVRPFLQVIPTGSSSGGGSSSLLGVMTQDEGIPLGTGTTINFVGAGVTATISGSVVNVNIPTPSTTVPVTGSVVIQDEGQTLGSSTILNFVGSGISTSISGSVTRINIESCGTYQRVEPPVSLGGSLFQVPDLVYASGSLGVFYNGLLQLKGSQYEELIYISGTYHLLFSPATGSVHMVSYGVPCTTQTYITGSGSLFDLQDSDSILLQDSDGVQLLDSDG